MIARRSSRVFAPIVALCLATASATAFAADEAGKAGVAKQLETVSPSADAYLSYHGRLFVEVSSSLTEEYRWGGTSCGSKTLSDELVKLLADAVRNGLSVTPRYQAGQGGSKCLVGFSLTKIGK